MRQITPTTTDSSLPAPQGDGHTAPRRDNVILILAIVVAALNFVAVITAIIAFNWLSVILSLLNTIVWVAVILVQLRRASRPGSTDDKSRQSTDATE